ncbi:MAG: tRNA lysidine(34) synthetase TilS [Spongiibacteraceae bacterium]
MNDVMSALHATLTAQLACQRWYVAYSGGLDSAVLLHACQTFLGGISEPRPQLLAIHINHQLQDDAGDWEQHCQSFCERHNIEILCRRVVVNSLGDGVESAARDARYQVFESILEEGDALLLGHHLDDQVETTLFRMLRGGGFQGLAGMPVSRKLGGGLLLRPFLFLPQQILRNYANKAELSWIEDPSNRDTHFDRNYLRHEVTPVLAARWPDYRQRLAKLSRIQGASAAVLNEYLQADVERLLAVDGSLELAPMAAFSVSRQISLLRHFLYERFDLSMSEAQLLELRRQFVDASEDAQPEFRRGDYQIKKYQGRLYCLRAPLVDASELADFDALLTPDESLQLPGGGELRLLPGGHFLPEGELRVRLRRGGERCQLPGEDMHRSVKKLLQQRGVPAWQRPQTPLIYCGGNLAALADIHVCESYYTDDITLGWRVKWRPPAQER